MEVLCGFYGGREPHNSSIEALDIRRNSLSLRMTVFGLRFEVDFVRGLRFRNLEP